MGRRTATPSSMPTSTARSDADILNQWHGWFQTLDAAGIVVVFNIYDDLIDILPGKRMNWD